MIHAYGAPEAPAARLLAALAARGHAVSGAAGARPPEGGAGPRTLVLAPGPGLEPLALGVLLGAWRSAPRARVLVLSRIGAHPDARAPGLRRAWMLEEVARSTGLPALALRVAPLLGPRAPLWSRLRQRPRLPRGGRQVLQPVLEEDVVETLVRAFDGAAGWDGWYELAGEEAWSLAELAARAADAGPPPRGAEAAWEPPVGELEEHRLAEPGPWREAFGIEPGRIGAAMAGWAP